jgi:hypothetical protein
VKRGYSIEVVREIWNDSTGERLDVRQDRDSLGLVELLRRGSDSKETQSLTMTTAEAKLLLQTLPALIEELEELEAEHQEGEVVK